MLYSKLRALALVAAAADIKCPLVPDVVYREDIFAFRCTAAMREHLNWFVIRLNHFEAHAHVCTAGVSASQGPLEDAPRPWAPG